MFWLQICSYENKSVLQNTCSLWTINFLISLRVSLVNKREEWMMQSLNDISLRLAVKVGSRKGGGERERERGGGRERERERGREREREGERERERERERQYKHQDTEKSKLFTTIFIFYHTISCCKEKVKVLWDISFLVVLLRCTHQQNIHPNTEAQIINNFVQSATFNSTCQTCNALQNENQSLV